MILNLGGDIYMMTDEDKLKVFDLRCKSKQGVQLTKKETKYIHEMYQKFPEEYSAMNKEVFDATKPFGAL